MPLKFVGASPVDDPLEVPLLEVAAEPLLADVTITPNGEEEVVLQGMSRKTSW